MALLMENGEGRSIAENLMSNTNLPFTDRALRFPLPDKFKVPWIDRYDGSGDPSNHMESFRAHLILHGTPDEIACRAFPLTSKRVAKEWFGNLNPKSIDNFDTLGCQFMNQFLAARRRKKNPAYLLSLVQGKTESLENYMQRFNQEKLTVESPNKQTDRTKIYTRNSMNRFAINWLCKCEVEPTKNRVLYKTNLSYLN